MRKLKMMLFGASLIMVVRVLVKGKCPVPSSAETSSASGMGNDATVELSPVAGRNVLGIRDGIIRDQTALRTLQEYIRTQCLR